MALWYSRLKKFTTALLLLVLMSSPVIVMSLPVLAEMPSHLKVDADQILQTGEQLLHQRQYSVALEKFQQALEIYRRIKDRSGEGTALTGIAEIYYNQALYPKALEFYQQSMKLWQTTENINKQAATLYNIGYTYFNLRQYLKALESYQQALVIHKQIGESGEEGAAFTNSAIGFTYEKLGQYPKALDVFQKALARKENCSSLLGRFTQD
jgi:tetratricopeptide (TPR) repeat protein